MKIRLFYVLAIVIPFLFNCGGGGSSDISTVKNGTMMMDQSVTVGNALEGYKFFGKKEWKTLSDPQKRRIVEFIGYVNMPAVLEREKGFLKVPTYDKRHYATLEQIINETKDCVYYAQFQISTDGKQFTFTKSGLRYYLKKGDVLEKAASFVYNDPGTDLMSELYKNDENAIPRELIYNWYALHDK